LGGAVQILGVDRAMSVLYSSDCGFDDIPVALLGQNQPVGVSLSAILFGALRNGSDLMQLRSGGRCIACDRPKVKLRKKAAWSVGGDNPRLPGS